MACMDHVCTNPKCDWQSCDNVPRYEACPKCGSPVQSSCDEDPDPEPGEEYDP